MIIRRGETDTRATRGSGARDSAPGRDDPTEQRLRPAPFVRAGLPGDDRPEAVMSVCRSHAPDDGAGFAGSGPTGGVTGRFFPVLCSMLAYPARWAGTMCGQKALAGRQYPERMMRGCP